MPAENYDAALAQLQAYGLAADALDLSGRIVRVDSADRRGKKDCWYALREFRIADGRTFIVGSYGDWRHDDRGHRIEPGGAPLSAAERAELQRQRAEQRVATAQVRTQLATDAARRARDIWAKLPTSGRSLYLQHKGVKAYGIRFSQGGSIAVPLYKRTDELVGLQFIAGDGTKRFLTGTEKRGAYHAIGDFTAGSAIAVVEGYATGATVHAALDCPVAIAFDAGNLEPVAAALRAQHPDLVLLICGDDDHATSGNPGRTQALATAERHRGIAIVPRFQDPAGRSDFNDLQAEQGLAAVRAQLTEALKAANNPITLAEVYAAVEVEAAVLVACAHAALSGSRSRGTSLKREAQAWRRLKLFRTKLHELRA